MQQWNNGPRLKGAAASRKWEDIRQDLLEGSRARDGEAKNRAFSQDSKNEWLDSVEGSTPYETKEETTNDSLRAMDVGALTTLGNFARTDRRKTVVKHPDRLAPYQGTAREKPS
jgi:hypothetical protein